MAGLLAWAVDVVGGHGKEEDDEGDSIPLVFSEDQRNYVIDLDQKAASLSRWIRDLRLRLPPPDISQRLPHIHAHSLASNAALALQLNAHSATREQAQMREETLQQENAEYEKAISDCESKILDKRQELESLFTKLEELEDIDKKLRAELDEAQAALDATQSVDSGESVFESNENSKDGSYTETLESDMLEKLEKKKREMSSMEERVHDLEKKWAVIQDKALKQPSPAQREKILDKQLHGLIEQLAAKQAQAEGLVSEIRMKEMELERLNGLWKRFEATNIEANAARNRFRRTNSDRGFGSDYDSDAHHLSYNSGARNESQNRLIYRRSAFVAYILALHILVFIKISF